ncbi:MAG TPA: 5'-methylthioadenosine/adenosylhomocysteine nucleosidase [Candidatus Izemoplasmatales bacterium]|nr:5'-methylthioadenosine/adenosylhomocysteine nucleosidase [Candidatus Izemoplasmatales bacterium]
MIGIIGALDIELNFFFKKMVIAKTELIANKTFYLGHINNKEVVIVKSDIGKVNAAITATILANHYQANLIINTGIAGGTKSTKLGDIILAEGLAYFDASTTAIDENPYGQLGEDPLIIKTDQTHLDKAKHIFDQLGYEYHVGHIVSGDKFVTKMRYLDKISNNVPNILACEMEGMAIAMTAYKFDIPFVSIRGISDLIEEHSQTDSYFKVAKEVASKSSNFVLSFLEAFNENN